MTKINSVFIINNDSSLIKVGTINDENKKINLDKSGLKSVDYFNTQVLQFIQDDDNTMVKTFHFINSEDIFGIIFHIIRWRGCTGYLVVQKSDRGLRYLCYLYDKIKHNASSFGTTIDLVKTDFIIKEFKKAKEELMIKLKNYEAIIDIKNAILKIGGNIEKSFGI